MSEVSIESKEGNIVLPDFSQLTLGNYEIKFIEGSDIDNTPLTNIESARYIKTINGADVKEPKDSHLKYTVVVDNRKGMNVQSVNFTIPNDDMKLGHFLSTSPYGLIKKNRTGVGATTLELKSPRNSIVVVPTKSLAHDKVANSKDSTGTYQYYYIGSSITGLVMPEIHTYLENDSIKYKKFVVVADSLHKLIKDLGDKKTEYFLMVDEIDSYQYDSSYRPSLENVIDYYFEFPSKQRCMVSATIGDFTNPLLNEEPVIEVMFNKPHKRNISLYHTNNAALTTAKKIQELRKKYPNDHILVAYNSIKRGVLPVIELLSDEDKQECAVLCSKDSKPYVEEYYIELEHQQLTKKITLMTCTYFVGVDIKQPFHLISVADVKVLHTLLSLDKFQQIAGRCRVPNGLLSESIIYTSNDNMISISSSAEIKDEVLNDANMLISYVEACSFINKNLVARNFPSMDIDIEVFAKNMKKRYYGSNMLQIIRKTNAGKLTPFYFNIDGLIIQNTLLENLYADKKNLYNSLEAENNVDYQEIVEDVEDNAQVNDKVDEKMRMTDDACFNMIYERMESLENPNSEDYIRAADEILIKGIDGRKVTRVNQKILDRFKELIEYVPFDSLLTKLQELSIESSEKKYEKFVQEVMFWALDKEHPFKKHIMEAFKVEESYTNKEIADKMNEILTIHFKKTILTPYKAISKLKMFCSLERTTQRLIKGGKPVSVYKILGYDVHNFNCNPTTPLKNATISEVFKGLEK